jgi:hypothetical protein
LTGTVAEDSRKLSGGAIGDEKLHTVLAQFAGQARAARQFGAFP